MYDRSKVKSMVIQTRHINRNSLHSMIQQEEFVTTPADES